LHPITLYNEALYLLPQKGIWWPSQKMLIISDTHFGKTGHFRKMGIAVPQPAFKNDMHRFTSMIVNFHVESVVIVGDMFHSYENKEADFFIRWRHDLPWLRIHLVRGNHDILPLQWYNRAAIELHEADNFCIHPFRFVHDVPNVTPSGDQYLFSGHVHPAIALKGKARQHLKLPCFLFRNDYAVLPAFGNFTGNVAIKFERNDRVFAIANNDIIPIEKYRS